MTRADRSAFAALATLIMLQLIMLTALYAGVRPHPPAATPLFGIAPFLGASVSAAISAMIMQPLNSAAGRGLSIVAAVMALVSFGPQKYFDPQFALISPAVILGQSAAFVIFAQVIKAIRRRENNDLTSAPHIGQI